MGTLKASKAVVSIVGIRVKTKSGQSVIYNVVYTITVDGILDETSRANAEWKNRFHHIMHKSYKRPFHATRTKMLWGDENIYFFVELILIAVGQSKCRFHGNIFRKSA